MKKSSLTVENESSVKSNTGSSTLPTSCSSRAQSELRICQLPTISVEESPPNILNAKISRNEAYSPEAVTGDEIANSNERNNTLENLNGESEFDISTSGESVNLSLTLKDYEDGGLKFENTGDDNELMNVKPLTTRRENRAKSLGPSLRRRGRNSANIRKALSEEAKVNEIQAEDLEKRLKALAAAFSERTERTKKKIEQPPTPSSEESDSDELKPGELTLLERLRQLASPGPSEFGDSRRKSISEKIRGGFLEKLSSVCEVLSCNYILDPQSSVYIGWLLIVTCTFLYNAVVIPLRIVFPYQTEQNELIWIIFDGIADAVYLIDMVAFKPHVKFIQSGFWVKKPKETAKCYIASLQFKIDLISMLPADIIINCLYKNVPLLRTPRIFKVETFWELFRQLDTYLANPHRARIFHTCLYMLYMIHMVACSYYAVSTWEGIGTTTWTFDGHGNAYVRCFYFATKTATSIGKNPKPENELEYVFMTFAWLSGVFVTAILIGQIRDIIATATKSQTEYRILTSATVSYLHRLGVPRRLQDRVKLWLSYTWEQQKTLDETRILNLLPKNMKAEIALNIHVETLAKVKLFQNCETAFLRDLVVKLRSIIMLPGDFVCRKGEIGREMFIVKSGKIFVIGGSSGNQVLATLCEGSVFGEIALLGIGGMNKRTADVKAAGFVNLFVLNKADLNDVIRDYPEAQEILQRKAKKFMRENIKKARASPSPAATSDDATSLIEESAGVIIKNKSEPPQLIGTMMKLFPPTTKIGRYLRKGSRVSSGTYPSGGTNSPKIVNKLDEGNAYSSASYPPSPYFPTSPGHISPELDISIMTGDSSDKRLSPPITDSTSELSSLLSDDNKSFSLNPKNEFENTPEGIEGETETRNSFAGTTPTSTSLPENRHTTSGNIPDPNDDRVLERCSSPLPPFLRKEDIPNVVARRASLIPNVALLGKRFEMGEAVDAQIGGQVTKSYPRVEAIEISENRDDIPLQLRPPLYIIEPGIYGFFDKDDRNALATTSKTLPLDSSEESKNKQEFGKVKSSPVTRGMSVGVGDEMTHAGAIPKASLIASQFVLKVKGTLKKQNEVDMDLGEQSKEEAHRGTTYKHEQYSLDIDSD